MKSFLDKHLSTLLVVALFLFLYFNGIFSHHGEGITERRDTSITNIIVAGQGQSHTPNVNLTIPAQQQNIPQAYQPDTSYKGILRQYEKLLAEHYATNVSRDTLRLDSLGQVYLTDSVRANNLLSRKYNYKLTIPEKTITITKTLPPRRQLYTGIEISSQAPFTTPEDIKLGFLYKTKKDQQLGVSAGINLPTLKPVVELKYYRKLSFK